VVFADRVAIGEYFYADIHRMAGGLCKYPAYLDNRTTKPYYVPFRALVLTTPGPSRRAAV
jgi:hypothetical protein